MSIFSLLLYIMHYALFSASCVINKSRVLFLQRERKARQCYTLKDLHSVAFSLEPN